MGIKVSDEFAVPLCATHHHQLHNTTKEREWWQERKIDPLMIANTLWRESQKRGPDKSEAVTQKPSDSATNRIEHTVIVREISTATDQAE